MNSKLTDFAGTRAVRAWPALAFVLAIGFTAVVAPVDARAVSQRVKNACGSDYSRFCSAYKVGSAKLRQCMRSNRRRLSKRCLRALVDAGQISRRAARKLGLR